MDLELTGSRVLVTGGTRGIGRAIVKAFLAEGVTVAFYARNAEKVTAAAAAVPEPSRASGTALDVGDAALAAWVVGSAKRPWAASTQWWPT